MKKRVLGLLLSMTMVAGMLTACGGNANTAASTGASADGNAADATAADAPAAAGDEGKVLNIYCWNEEFKSRVADHYPGYTETDATSGKIGDVTVKWNITPNENNAYQNNLDEALLKQADAAADDKIDIFLVEADYALKYVDADVSMPVADLGIADADIANQYKYTQDVMTDSNGKLKGLSWQGCPGVLIYNRAAAKEVLGSDDPAEVQKSVADWDTFLKTAEQMKAKGYSMTSTTNDAYRVFSNNVSSKWVQDGVVKVDPSIMKWVEMTKKMVDAKEVGSTSDLWSDDWSKGFYPDGKTFCYFGPAWMINFSMAADTEGSIAHDGGWGATEGPQGFFWGGTWICAAQGTDNASLVADIMKQLTTNKDIMLDIVAKDSDFVNNKPAMEEAATKDEYAFAPLGGQNPLAMFCNGAEKCDLSNQCEYDQGCNEEFQKAMKNYFDGNATLDQALEMFNSAIVEKYPELKTE
ncbi:ABC-type glycerol-3-phosphate transport system, substrate-binding protein [Butyrivibrio hungatei]|uniref:ABC-type glycerol-3-phosphate transport system, substrate-binding protein n=1 Tax=Butyrivibrio hungatei TaxID=185008 RepID=A0A1G5FSN3_9FIRM|nr:ABC transporter substrate-binding protein [Butyrivibrio hungatei]SCY42191.1 ABC-type glycerol-3-phosphate transport system, substrate-binding protein [Butyrivibrio hungatei]